MNFNLHHNQGSVVRSIYCTVLCDFPQWELHQERRGKLFGAWAVRHLHDNSFLVTHARTEHAPIRRSDVLEQDAVHERVAGADEQQSQARRAEPHFLHADVQVLNDVVEDDEGQVDGDEGDVKDE